MLHKRNGILPEALINFVVRLGWSHGNDEIISRAQMIEWFGFDHVGSTSGVWNPEKLLWLNQHYLKTLPETDIAERLVPFLEERGVKARGDARLTRVVLALRERSKTLVEMAELARPFFSSGVELDPKAAAKHLDRGGQGGAGEGAGGAGPGVALGSRRPGRGAEGAGRVGRARAGKGRPAGAGGGDRLDGEPGHRGDPGAHREGRVAASTGRCAALEFRDHHGSS